MQTNTDTASAFNRCSVAGELDKQEQILKSTPQIKGTTVGIMPIWPELNKTSTAQHRLAISELICDARSPRSSSDIPFLSKIPIDPYPIPIFIFIFSHPSPVPGSQLQSRSHGLEAIYSFRSVVHAVVAKLVTATMHSGLVFIGFG